MTATGDNRGYPFWGYPDLAMFVGAILPSFAVGMVILRAVGPSGEAARTFVFQSLIYLLLSGALYLVISWRYGQPFWRSLRWISVHRAGLLCLIAGPPLAIATAALGAVLRAPVVPSPIEDLISDRRSLVIMMLFAVVLGPVFEELTFRGFLFPVLARTMGPWPGIFLTAAPFALLHGSQYHWSWQHLVVIGVAGTAFGYARYKTGSTFASAMVHAGYNAMLFVGFVVQRWL
jgi:membrane protease YdiL (CAAX protease family)